MDDSTNILPDDRMLLIVENDTNFSRYLLEMSHDNGFKAVVAARGTIALALARDLKPHAITLDINLPDIDGWRVLDRLKDDVATRHIPVQLITTEEERERGLRMGAMGALAKPLKTRETLDQAFGPHQGVHRTAHAPRAAGATRCRASHHRHRSDLR